MYEVISDRPPSSFTLRIAVGSWTAFTEKPEKMQGMNNITVVLHKTFFTYLQSTGLK